MPNIRLPQVDKVLREPALIQLGDTIRRDILTVLVRERLDFLRQEGRNGEADEVAQSVAASAEALLRPGLRKVINGTGVVLNTNLGRAPIGAEFLQRAQELGSGYCNLEIDLATGKRGKRTQRLQRLLKLLTGAEGAIVVNNNAAAVVLAVNAFARNKEVIVSRGELIEIGGSFRLPDVIESAGGILKEVGTTNRTRVADFKKAIGTQTGLMMRCHRSNFEVKGFTEEVSLQELVTLGKDHNVPVLEDLGSGVLCDLSSAVKDEPTVERVVASGCDMISFSGDKLLGGPQAGIIVGTKNCIDRLSQHPLYRALRADKLTLSLLEQTLIAYLRPEPQQHVPVLGMIMERASDIKNRAENFVATVFGAHQDLKLEVVETNSAAGGGSLPGESLPSWGIKVQRKDKTANKLAELLRSLETPVIAVVQNDEVIIDFRTISTEELPFLQSALNVLAKK